MPSLKLRHASHVAILSKAFVSRQDPCLFSQFRYASYLASSPKKQNEARLARDRMKEATKPFFEEYDALLMPVSPTSTFPYDHTANQFDRVLVVDEQSVPYHSWLCWICFATVLHHPSVVVRCGTSASGLPIGLQIVGKWGSEEMLLDIGQQIEALCGGFREPEMAVLL